MMKKWKCFPLLVKVHVLGNLDVLERITFAKSSKASLNLVGATPLHLTLVKLIHHWRDRVLVCDSFFRWAISVEDLLILLSFRKVSIDILYISLENRSDHGEIQKLVKSVKNEKRFIRIDTVASECMAVLSDGLENILKICDQKYLKILKIKWMPKQNVLRNIIRTAQWKSCEKLNLVMEHQRWEPLKIENLDVNEFSHFKNIYMKVSGISVDDAWNIVKSYQHIRKPCNFTIVDVMEGILKAPVFEKILTEWPSDRWFSARPHGSSICLPLPDVSNLYFYVSVTRKILAGGIVNQEKVEDIFGNDFESRKILLSQL